MPTGTGTKKKTTTTKAKSNDLRSNLKLTKKDEAIVKQRLKKLLEKEGATKSSTKPSTSKRTSGAGCSNGSCFTTSTAASAKTKKVTASSSSKSPSCSTGTCYFQRKDDNVTKRKKTTTTTTAKAKSAATTSKAKTTNSTTKKPTATNKKATTTTKKPSTSTTKKVSCSNGQCTLKPSKPKSSTTSSKSSKNSGGQLQCTSGGCFFLNDPVKTAKKTNSTKTTSTKRKAPEAKLKSLPVKKSKSSSIKKSQQTNKNPGGGTSYKKSTTSKVVTKKPIPVKKTVGKTTTKLICSSGKCNLMPKRAPEKKTSSNKICTPCGFDTEDDDDDDDYSDEDDFSDDFTSDDDDDSEDDDNFGGCGPAKRGTSRKWSYASDSSGSWETENDDSFVCTTGNCPSVRKRPIYNSVDNDDNDMSTFVEENTNLALIPCGPERKDNEFQDDENETNDYSCDYSEGSSFDEETSDEEDESWEDSEYSMNESSNDDDYQLPDSEAEDVYIRQGEAKIYSFQGEEEINFDSDASSLQLIEFPPTAIVEEKMDDVDSVDSCPQLIPIHNNSLEENVIRGDSFYSDFSQSEDEENGKYLRMSAHVFDVSNNVSNSFSEQQISYKDNEKTNESSFENIMFDNLTPLQRSFGINASICNDNSKYEIISVDRISDLNLKTMGNLSVMKESTIIKNKTSNSLQNDSIDVDNDEIDLEETVENNESFLDESLDSNEMISPNLNLIENCTEYTELESKFYNANNSRHVLVLLKNIFYIYGTLKIKLIAGAVEIFGYEPQIGEIHEIYSPRGYCRLYMKPIQSKNDNYSRIKLNYELKLLRNDFLKTELDCIAKEFNEKCDAIILLEANDRNDVVKMLKKYMKQNLFPNMNSITQERSYCGSEFILRCMLYTDISNAIKIDPAWDSINIKENSKILLVGGKGVGKSTLLRYLINRNLQRFKKFLLIDLDIGQTEIFVPQTISATLIETPLLGPGYFYCLDPEKSYVFGDTNVILSPINYLKIVKQLLEWCRNNEELQNVPWIVNTMGYNKGIGSELISIIAQILQPTDIVQIQSAREVNNFDFIMCRDVIKTIPKMICTEELNLQQQQQQYEPSHELFLFNSIEKVRTNEWDMNAKDTRFAVIVSRLGAILKGKHEWLSDVKPVWAPIKDLDVICFAEDDHVEKDILLDVIDANLVYLCRKDGNCYECYGIGIVRGVDRYQQKVYLLPSIGLSKLIYIDTLALCNIPLPTAIILNQGPEVKGIAPYTYNTCDFIATKHINQIYSRPQRFLQGKPKNILQS